MCVYQSCENDRVEDISLIYDNVVPIVTTSWNLLSGISDCKRNWREMRKANEKNKEESFRELYAHEQKKSNRNNQTQNRFEHLMISVCINLRTLQKKKHRSAINTHESSTPYTASQTITTKTFFLLHIYKNSIFVNQ